MRMERIPVLMFCVLVTCMWSNHVVQAQVQGTIQYNIIEELAPGSFVGNIKQDAQITGQGALTFSFFPATGTHTSYFSIESNTGVMRTVKKIDRDSICPSKLSCPVQIDIAVQSADYFKIVKVTVNLIDLNDNWPRFPKDTITLSISELTPARSAYALPKAKDIDSPMYGIQGYQLMSNSGKFQLDTKNHGDGDIDLQLVLKENLNRETAEFYRVRVLAKDGGTPAKTGTLTVDINVLDVNDNSPQFENSTYEVDVWENTDIGKTVVIVVASDKDSGLNGEIEYRFTALTQEAFGRLFGINATTGGIYLKQMLDYSRSSQYILTVVAADKGQGSVPTRARVVIRVLDVNDNPPQITAMFLRGFSFAKISEHAKIGSFIAQVRVSDPDGGQNGRFNCTLQSLYFRLEKKESTGTYTEFHIFSTATFDFEQKALYEIMFKCKDFGNPSKESRKTIQVAIVDENDHPPQFLQTHYFAALDENNKKGKRLAVVNATDRDAGPNADIRFSIHPTSPPLVHVDPKSGVVTADIRFDRESRDRAVILILATDLGTPALSSTATLEITILDVNDNKPLFSLSHYELEIYENQAETTEVGSVIASDADAPPNNVFSFSIVPSYFLYHTFRIGAESGKIFTKRPLNREEIPVYQFVIAATDTSAPWHSSTANVTVRVKDENDNKPKISFPNEFNNTVYLSSMASIGEWVSKIKATDADKDSNGQLSYDITGGDLHRIFMVEQKTGVIKVKSDLKPYDHRTFQLQITVSDHGFPPKTAVANLNIVVNKSVAFPVPDSPLLSQQNFVIVISLAGASGFLIIILVIVIVIIRRQNQRDANGKYISRTQIWNMTESQRQHVPNGENVHLEYGSSEGDSMDKDGDLSMDKDTSGSHNMSNGMGHQMSGMSEDSSNKFQSTKGPSAVLTNGTLNPHGVPARPPKPPRISSAPQNNQNANIYNPTYGLTKPDVLSEKDLKVHHWLDVCKKDKDSDSACSAEVSNSDSGRGTSEADVDPASHSQPDNGLQRLSSFSNTPHKGFAPRTDNLNNLNAYDPYAPFISNKEPHRHLLPNQGSMGYIYGNHPNRVKNLTRTQGRNLNPRKNYEHKVRTLSEDGSDDGTTTSGSYIMEGDDVEMSDQIIV